MQLFTSLGKPWDASAKPLCKTLLARFPVEFVTLFSFIFIAQQFIEECSYAVLIHLVWTVAMYLAYIVRSHCNSERFNRQLNLDSDEIVELFHQLPNYSLFQDVLFSNYQSSTEWINYFFAAFWPKFSSYFKKKFKNFTFTLIQFFDLANFTVGLQPPLVESLSSSLKSHSHQHILTVNFEIYWFARTGKHDQSLVELKFFHYSIGSLLSFIFKANCQVEFKFMQWKVNEEIQLNDIQFAFTSLPKLHHLNATGLFWLLDNLQLIRPIVYFYLSQRFLSPKRAVFKFASTSPAIQPRKPLIGCPAALFCIDVIQAENVPMSKRRKQRQANERPKNANNYQPTTAKRCKLLRCCSNTNLPSAYCRVKIFGQQFTCQAVSSTNPLWNFRSFIPVFSHDKHSIEQLDNYHSLFNQMHEIQNPVDLNASYYQFPHSRSPSSTHSSLQDSKFKLSGKEREDVFDKFKQFVTFEFLEHLIINIQLLDRQTGDQEKVLADFQIVDSSQYFLDSEFNGQSIWISSVSSGVQVKDLVDQSIKLNVRFTFLTLNQSVSPVILSNAHLANRLAFPIGVMLVFIDSAIGINLESVKSSLNPKIKYGFQIVCQLGSQTLYSSICTDLSFIWENEMLFCVYSLNLEKLVVKLIARSLNSGGERERFNYANFTTLATNRLDLVSLAYEPNMTFQEYCPLMLKSNKVQLKMLLTFRVVHFTAKLTTNCLRNAKVAEEDLLVRDKLQYKNFDNKSASPKAKQTAIDQPPEDEHLHLVESNLIVKKQVDDELNGDELEADQMDQNSNDELAQTVNDGSIEPASAETTDRKPKESVNIELNVRMRWPKVNKLVIEFVDMRSDKFLALFQMYSIDVYLVCVLREKEKAIQLKRTKNFQLRSATVPINQELQFNCISKPLPVYHLNISLHEKRTEEYSKIAEIYMSMPSLILASGQIEKQIVLNITPMYLKTSGFNEIALKPDSEFEQFDMTTNKQEIIGQARRTK